MVNTKKLVGLIAEHGYTREQIAEKLGISDPTFRRRLRTGIFDSDEMYKLVKILEIDDPAPIFFADDGA